MSATPAPPVRNRIFINYRREDSEVEVGRLAADLSRIFGADQVFQDVASIAPGEDFADALRQGLDSCAAVLVVIGPLWLTATDARGRRRLDLADDWVRREVAESLKDKAVRIFPVLIRNASMPVADELPEDIQALARRQAYPATTRHWANDVAELAGILKRVPGLGAAPAAVPSTAPDVAPATAPAPKPAVAPAAVPSTPPVIAAAAAPMVSVPVKVSVTMSTPPVVAPAAVPSQKPDVAPAVAPSPKPDVAPPRGGGDTENAAPGANRDFVPSASRAAAAKSPRSWIPIAGVGAAVLIAVGLYVSRMREPAQDVARDAAAVVAPAAAPVAPAPATVVAGPPAPKAGESFRDCDQCPEMVVIPAGSFTMGSPDNEKGRYGAEGPQHRVTMTRPFAAGKYEATFEQWDACVTAGGCQHKPEDHGRGRGRQPVMSVSWEDVQAYLAWLSKKTGKAYRLLSEAEWEYAARAGTTTRYPWGDDPGTNLANFGGSGSQWGGKQAESVGSFAANRFGLHDMSGNVSEWTQDCWNENYDGAPVDGSAWQNGDCVPRVVRGGSWFNGPDGGRAASRYWVEPAHRDTYLGFRLARTL